MAEANMSIKSRHTNQPIAECITFITAGDFTSRDRLAIGSAVADLVVSAMASGCDPVADDLVVFITFS